jgi:hypothetical protein
MAWCRKQSRTSDQKLFMLSDTSVCVSVLRQDTMMICHYTQIISITGSTLGFCFGIHLETDTQEVSKMQKLLKLYTFFYLTPDNQ